VNTKQVALYARVSSEQKAEAKTIESQLADIRARISADGFEQSGVLEFVDEGYSGSTLVRPALERLRDVAAAGGMDRLYVHCHGRFARNYAYPTNSATCTTFRHRHSGWGRLIEIDEVEKTKPGLGESRKTCARRRSRPSEARACLTDGSLLLFRRLCLA